MIWFGVFIAVLFVGVQEVKTQKQGPEFYQFDNLFINAAKKYGVNWRWLKAIAMNESSLGQAPSVKKGLLNPSDVQSSKSSDGLSWGIMQVTLKTAKSMDPKATEVKLNDPIYSVDLAAKYISQLKAYYSQTDPRFIEWIVKSYNQGPGNTRKEIQGNKGYADEYWARFQRNLTKINEVQP